MKPFLELPVCLANNEQKQKVVTGRVQPEDISYYYPGFYEGTVIVMKAGSSLLTTIGTEELDSALQAYHQLRAKNAGHFGNLQITQKKKPNLHVTD